MQTRRSSKSPKIWIAMSVALVLLTILGVTALPNLLAARQRNRQKRTMSDMRSIGTAMGSYQVDFNGYPDVTDVDALAKVLDPKYIVDMPRADGWGMPYRLERPPARDGLPSSYTLVSPGSDRAYDGYQRDLIRSFDCDIIYNDGQFVQSPEGVKKSSDERILRVLDLDSRRTDAPEADPTWVAVAAQHPGVARLDDSGRRLMEVKAPSSGGGGPAMVERFERDVAADTVRNEYLLHAEVHRWFAGGVAPGDATTLDAHVYDELFRAPQSDPWVGLSPRSLDRTPHRWVVASGTSTLPPAILPASQHGGRSPAWIAASSRAFAARDPQVLARLAIDRDEETARSAVAALRSLGPTGLEVFLAAHGSAVTEAGAHPSAERTGDQERVLHALDALAAQKDAHASRLFWYTDLREACAAAAATGRPILSLRMLGKLDEELSCANSRFFRTTLYPHAEISRKLAERFVLHWHSVRPVPRISIDFGDGRVLRQTIAGNSAHYVLDAGGRPLDALPGMYGPAAFLAWLRSADDLARRVSSTAPPQRRTIVRAYHHDRLLALGARWQESLDSLAPGSAAGASPSLAARARVHREMAASAPSEDAEALDRAVYAAFGLPLQDPCLGLSAADVFTGIDEAVERPRHGD